MVTMQQPKWVGALSVAADRGIRRVGASQTPERGPRASLREI